MMKYRKLKATLISIVLVLSSFGFQNVSADTFDEGNVIATVALGNGRFFNENYLIIGGGVGYFVADGIEVGLDADIWTGGNRSVYELTPKITYVHDFSPKLKPYIGAFYNRTYIEDFDDSDAMGYRVGVYIPTDKKIYFGFGVVSTELQDCTNSIFTNCSDTYTEISVIFAL